MTRILALVLLLSGLSVSAGAEEISGTARAVDGDTLRVGDQVIRLMGVDAPALKQVCHTKKDRPYPCGATAARELMRMVGGRKVVCTGTERDAEGRLVARCLLNGIDIGRLMVVNGWALAHGDGSEAYARVQYAAEQLREGMWKGKFTNPWEWRP